MASRSLTHYFPTFGKLSSWLRAGDSLASRQLRYSAVGVAAILISALLFLTISIREHLQEDERANESAVQQAAREAALDLAALETAQRSFLLTGQGGPLEQFDLLRHDFQVRILALVPLLRNDVTRRESVRFIDRRFQAWINEAALPEIAARKNGVVFSTAASNNPDNELFGRARTDLGRFLHGSTDALESLNTSTRIWRMVQTSGFAILGVLAIGFLVTSNVRSYRLFRQRLQTSDAALTQNRAIIDNTLDGVITADESGTVQSLNPAAERMFVQTAENVIGKHVSLLIPQRLFFHDARNKRAGAVLAMGQRQGYYPFQIEVALNEMEVGGRRQFVAVVRDVSERQRSEDTLRQISLGVSAATGEEFLRSLLKQLSKALKNDFAFLLELTGKDAEQTALLTLAEEGDIRSATPFDLAHTAFADAVGNGFFVMSGGARAKFAEDKLIEELAAESMIAVPLIDHNGRTLGLIGVLDRKTLGETQIAEAVLHIFATRAASEIERKRAEEDLAAEKERLAVTLRSMADGFITINNGGSVLMMNSVAERLTGWTQSEAAGAPLPTVFQIVSEKNRRPCSRALQRIVEAGVAEGLNGPALIVARDGVERLIESNTAPILHRAKGKIGAVIVFRDVTDKRRLEEEQQKAEKLESLGVVAGGIAHDFNNLLTAILGNLSLVMSTRDLDEAITDKLLASKKASHRAQELAQQLLTFARGGAPVKQTASINQLVRDTVSLALPGSKALCDFRLPDDLWPVDIDPGQMSQVLNNLAVNADQAMPAGGMLRVSAENLELILPDAALGLSAGRWVRVVMQDQGVGIPEEYLKKIFDPYFTTKPKGSGMGLATAYSIVRSHDGILIVESHPGEGSTFSIYLPASQNELQPEKTGPAPVAQSAARVLVLDDEEAICMLVTCALEPLGYQVTETNDGVDAIAAYEKAMQEGRPYDIVISDLTIPGGMGGKDTIKRLTEIDPNVCAIVSSGYSGDPVLSRHEEFGFSGMIAKPYEIDALGHKVAEVLAQKRTSRVVYHDFDDRKTA